MINYAYKNLFFNPDVWDANIIVKPFRDRSTYNDYESNHLYQPKGGTYITEHTKHTKHQSIRRLAHDYTSQ